MEAIKETLKEKVESVTNELVSTLIVQVGR
jgi:hypothetical protein